MVWEIIFLPGLVTSQGKVRENIPLSGKTWKCQGNCANIRKCEGNLGKNILLVRDEVK